jgi:hypothetical protein
MGLRDRDESPLILLLCSWIVCDSNLPYVGGRSWSGYVLCRWHVSGKILRHTDALVPRSRDRKTLDLAVDIAKTFSLTLQNTLWGVLHRVTQYNEALWLLAGFLCMSWILIKVTLSGSLVVCCLHREWSF